MTLISCPEVDTMPNGYRIPYRFPQLESVQDECIVDSPSPVHSSDTEETYQHKTKYMIVARRALRTWYNFYLIGGYTYFRTRSAIFMVCKTTNHQAFQHVVSWLRKIAYTRWPRHPAMFISEYENMYTFDEP